MGGRSGPKTSTLTNKRSSAQINKHLSESSSQVTFDVFMELMSATNPTIAALYTAYKVAEFVYPIAKAGVNEYNKSGDTEKVAEKVVVETAKQSVKEVEHRTIEMVVKTTYSKAVKSANIPTKPIVDTIVTTVMSDIIEETVDSALHG